MRRIFSQVYKNWILLRRNHFRLFDVTIWPLVLLFSITLFVGFLGGRPDIIGMVVMGIAGWRAVYHLQMEMNTGYMDEYWSNSINHFLTTPIRIMEFLIGSIITGVLKLVIVVTAYIIIGKYVFGFSIPSWPMFLMGLAILSLFGIAIGMMTLGLNIVFHEHSFAFTWAIADVVVLISGVYYPITIFPKAIQVISSAIPATYGFNVLKSMLGFATVNYLMLGITLLVWLGLGAAVLAVCYRYAKRHGRLGKGG